MAPVCATYSVLGRLDDDDDCSQSLSNWTHPISELLAPNFKDSPPDLQSVLRGMAATQQGEDGRNGQAEGGKQASLTSPSDALYYTQYGTWYPLFRKHAPKSTVLNVSSIQPEFLEWMQMETIVLPSGSGPSRSTSDPSTNHSDDDSESADALEVTLDALNDEIRRVLLKYDGGPVFPKLNWSAPLDAAFMLAGNNMQCFHPEDVYLLLRSSEFVATDLEQVEQLRSAPPIDTSVEPDSIQAGDVTLAVGQNAASSRPWHLQLVLKQWFAFNKSYEFRCFVRGGLLVAISQRDVTFYSHLQDSRLCEEIRDKLWEFWHSVIRDNFPIQDYIFDAYLSKDRSRVWLVDVNPWLPRTDPLLFTFEQLETVYVLSLSRPPPTQEDPSEDFVRLQLNADQAANETIDQCPWDAEDVDFRVLTDQRMQTNSATYSANMVPRDLVDFAKGVTPAHGPSSSTSDLSVSQVVEQWNRQVMAQDGSE